MNTHTDILSYLLQRVMPHEGELIAQNWEYWSHFEINMQDQVSEFRLFIIKLSSKTREPSHCAISTHHTHNAECPNDSTFHLREEVWTSRESTRSALTLMRRLEIGWKGMKYVVGSYGNLSWGDELFRFLVKWESKENHSYELIQLQTQYQY